MKEELEKKYGKGGDVLITFKDLEKLPVEEIFDFNINGEGNIQGLMMKNDLDDDLNFRAEISEGAVFNSHKHDCVESIIVYKGKLINLNNNDIIKRGKVHSFKKYEVHRLKALEETICYIEFENPHTKKRNDSK